MRYARSILSSLATLLLALVLAIFIWLAANQQQDPMRTQFLQLPVQFVGQPERSILVSPTTQEVQVRVEGPETALGTMSPDDFRATVDLSEVPFGQRVSVPVEVNSNSATLDPDTPSPEFVEVLLEEQVAREVPVELDIRGSLARGHAAGEPLVEPGTIVVSGPASRVGQLDFALATVFLNNARETIIGEHRPIFYDESGRVVGTNNLDLSTEEVQVTIPVEESAGFAEKLVTVDWIGEPAPGYRLLNVTPDPPSVLVQGLPARLNELTRLETEPIDITGLTESFTQQVTLELPAGVTLDQDQEVFVTVEIEPILSTDLRERPVQVLGVAEDVETAVDPEQVRIILFGPLPALDSLLDEDVRVTVDLFGLEPGTYSVEPQVDLPDRGGIEVRSVQPSSVAVTITPTITTTEELTATLPGAGSSLLDQHADLALALTQHAASAPEGAADTVPYTVLGHALLRVADLPSKQGIL